MSKGVRALLSVLGAVALVAVGATSADAAFTGPPAALKLVREMRAAYSRVKAVEDVWTGALVYCPAFAEGWTYAPQPGCRSRARVSEEDDLANGHVVRAVGLVTAPGRPSLRYVVSNQGWFQASVGATCWKFFHLPFVAPLWISYPFADERLSIVGRGASAIVMQATATASGYRELDYVNPRTHLLPREVQFTTAHAKTYRVTIHSSVLAQATAPVETPVCEPTQ
jgi:hypothetical protein